MGEQPQLGRITTGEIGLTGIKIGPDGNIWMVNRLDNKLKMVQPSDVSAIRALQQQIAINIAPNPTKGLLHISIPELGNYTNAFIRINTSTGKEVLRINEVNKTEQIDLSHLPNGIYILSIQGDSFFGTEKIILNK